MWAFLSQAHLSVHIRILIHYSCLSLSHTHKYTNPDIPSLFTFIPCTWKIVRIFLFFLRVCCLPWNLGIYIYCISQTKPFWKNSMDFRDHLSFWICVCIVHVRVELWNIIWERWKTGPFILSVISCMSCVTGLFILCNITECFMFSLHCTMSKHFD